jgi:hypothetical protein
MKCWVFLETSGSRSDEEMTLSINAMCGTDNSRCVKIQALMKDQAIL